MTTQAPTPPHLTLLNPEQYRAVTTVDGPLLILAGAGSGKTRVLTRRIAHLLHLGVEARAIYAVTFTNKAAAEMKERVIELVGEAGDKVWVSTFHSSCCRILRADIEVLGWTRRFAIYDDDDQKRMLKAIIGELGYDGTRVDARAIRSQIDHYKNRMQSPEDLLREHRAHANEPLIRIWNAYAEALQAADALDFNDLIGVTVRLFQEHPDVLEKWQDRFQYLMVDEYQDTNQGQYVLLKLLAARHRNLAVVGDDDQSIYGFRGADIAIIRGFENDYPETAVIRLEQNYRSSGNILALANHVIAVDENRIAKRLWTEAPAGPKVQFLVADTPRDEARRVSRGIAQLRRHGHRYDDIAIIYRTNATSRPFEAALQEVRAPYRIIGGKKFYARREIRDLLSYLRLLTNPADDAAFLRVVNVPTRGVGAKTMAKLREEATGRGQPLLRTARSFSGSKRAAEGLRTFTTMIDNLSDLARDVLLPELVTRAVEDSGYRAMLEADQTAEGRLTRDATGRMENLSELVRDAMQFTPPVDALTPLDVLTAWLDRIALTADSDDRPEDGEVTLMTVHNAKGLEYPVVFVVQMIEGQFPHAKSEERGMEEERRLAYVAFTRAKKRLVVTRSRKSIRLGQTRADAQIAAPSRFLFGLPSEVCEGDVPTADRDDDFEGEEEEPPAQRKLASFLARRRPQGEPLPEDRPVTLVDIESREQLTQGTRVHHPRFGVGEVRRVHGDRIHVRFGSQLHWVPGRQMQLVLEE